MSTYIPNFDALMKPQKLNAKDFRFPLAVVFAILIRLAVMMRGSNTDFESYQVVAHAVLSGETPWSTGRYNYGPIWSLIIATFDWFSFSEIQFRVLIVLTLTVADLVISIFIAKKFGLLLGLFFLFNPISVIISGYHNQFDNVAVAIWIMAMHFVEGRESEKLNGKDYLAAAIFAVSLSTKHVLLLFALWIALRQTGIVRKLFYLVVPQVLFMLTFAPFIHSDWTFIKQHVVDYRSFGNAPFMALLAGIVEFRYSVSTANIVFGLGVVALGFFLRKVDLNESFCIYLIAIVALTPGIANQYLAIAAVGAAAILNRWFFLFFIVSGINLLADGYWTPEDRPVGLHFRVVADVFPFVNIPAPGTSDLMILGQQYVLIVFLLITGLVSSIHEIRVKAST